MRFRAYLDFRSNFRNTNTKLYLFIIAVLIVLGLGAGLCMIKPASAQSSTLVVSQLFGGGGNSGAVLKSDFIELKNIGTASLDVGGMSVQYASASGATWKVTPLGSHTILAGGYLLIQQASGANGSDIGTALEAPDVVGETKMAMGSGKVALVANTDPIQGKADPDVVDFVGYGSASEAEGEDVGASLSSTTALERLGRGCADTDQNGTDFATIAPTPRNSNSPLFLCTIALPTEAPTVAPELTATEILIPTVEPTAMIPPIGDPTETVTHTLVPTTTIEPMVQATPILSPTVVVPPTAIATPTLVVVSVEPTQTMTPVAAAPVTSTSTSIETPTVTATAAVSPTSSSTVSLTVFVTAMPTATPVATMATTPIKPVLKDPPATPMKTLPAESTAVATSLSQPLSSNTPTATISNTDIGFATPSEPAMNEPPAKIAAPTEVVIVPTAILEPAPTLPLISTATSFPESPTVQTEITAPTSSVLPATVSPVNTDVSPSTTVENVQIWISEVMMNPSVVRDSDGEFLELYNPNDFAVDLLNWHLGDSGSDSHVITENVIIPPYGYAVLARNGNAADNGGLAADYIYSNIQLGNSADELILSAPDGRLVDHVYWGDGIATGIPAGASLERLMWGEPASWRITDSPWLGSAGDLGNPGDAHLLLANEIASNENQSTDESAGSEDFSMTPTAVAPVVIANTLAPEEVITAEYAVATAVPAEMWTATPALVNDEVATTDLATAQPTATIFAVEPGTALLPPTAIATSLAAPIILANGQGNEPIATVTESTDIASPATAATSTPIVYSQQPTQLPSLFFSEVMVNPSAISDSLGEFIELGLRSNIAVNLRGYVIADQDGESHTIEDDLWIEPNGVVLLARNGNPAENGGFEIDYVYSGISLANGGDELFLFSPDINNSADHVLLDQFVWSDESLLTPIAGASFERTELSVDGQWVIATEPWQGSAGDLGSPGYLYIHDAYVAGQSDGSADETGNEANEHVVSNEEGVAVSNFGLSYLPITFRHYHPYEETTTTSSANLANYVEPTATATQRLLPTATPRPQATSTSIPTPTSIANGSIDPTNTPPPSGSQNAIFISEVMINPKATKDNSSEFIEICNVSELAVNLLGWSLADLGSDLYTIESALWIPANGCTVLGRNSELAENGGVVIQHVYNGFNLSNKADEILLLDASRVEVDRLEWDEDSDIVISAGASLQRLANSYPPQWLTALEPWTGSIGDFGSPGAMTTGDLGNLSDQQVEAEPTAATVGSTMSNETALPTITNTPQPVSSAYTAPVPTTSVEHSALVSVNTPASDQDNSVNTYIAPSNRQTDSVDSLSLSAYANSIDSLDVTDNRVPSAKISSQMVDASTESSTSAAGKQSSLQPSATISENPTYMREPQLPMPSMKWPAFREGILAEYLGHKLRARSELPDQVNVLKNVVGAPAHTKAALPTGDSRTEHAPQSVSQNIPSELYALDKSTIDHYSLLPEDKLAQEMTICLDSAISDINGSAFAICGDLGLHRGKTALFLDLEQYGKRLVGYTTNNNTAERSRYEDARTLGFTERFFALLVTIFLGVMIFNGLLIRSAYQQAYQSRNGNEM